MKDTVEAVYMGTGIPRAFIYFELGYREQSHFFTTYITESFLFLSIFFLFCILIEIVRK